MNDGGLDYQLTDCPRGYRSLSINSVMVDMWVESGVLRSCQDLKLPAVLALHHAKVHPIFLLRSYIKHQLVTDHARAVIL